MKDIHNRNQRARLKALNSILPIFNNQANEFAEILSMTRCNVDEVSFLLDSVREVKRYISGEVERIKKEMVCITRCNSIYLQTQLIVSDDDALRYVDFMTMSYSVVAKDIVKLWQRMIYETTKIRNQTVLIRLLYRSYKSLRR